MLDSLFGVNEVALAYDMTRAHSADIWFLRLRAWTWGITCSVACLLIGNILGVFDINFFGMTWDFIKHLW